MSKYFTLLKEWCDKLIDLQITELKDPNFYGGIMCPACSMIHGRMGDAVYPFTLLYDSTGDEKYLDAAKKVIDWSEYNVRRTTGGYYNEKCSGWYGISAFSATAIGDAVLYHGNCLDNETREKWKNIFFRITDFVYGFFGRPSFHANINYFAGESALMALAYVLSGKEKYRTRAYKCYDYIKNHFSQNGLLYGEGPRKATAKGCLYIDLGYNYEESMPLLAKFAHLMKDESALKFVAEKFASHLEFMLPDGGLDNSFGTRANKWTYWGSRTSDGATEGLCYLTEYGDIFAEAAERSFDLLARCSYNGYLYGGLMYKEYGEDPCTHHSFCHAKAVAALIDSGFEYKNKTALPRESEYGLRYYGELHAHLIAKGSLRATVNATDAVCYDGAAVTGGTLTMLWSEKTGPVLSAVMARYGMSEPRNMQLSRFDDNMPNCALRISAGDFESVNDKEARVSAVCDNSKITVNAKGQLNNTRFEKYSEYSFEYIFESSDTLTVTAVSGCEAILQIPVLCFAKDSITSNGNSVIITKEKAVVTIEADSQMLAPEDTSFRNFTVIGGFASYPITVKLKENVPATVKIKITD